MTDKQFAEIIARALLMVIRALNTKYGLRMWILTRDERRAIMRGCSEDQSVDLRKMLENI